MSVAVGLLAENRRSEGRFRRTPVEVRVLPTVGSAVDVVEPVVVDSVASPAVVEPAVVVVDALTVEPAVASVGAAAPQPGPAAPTARRGGTLAP